MKNRIRKSFIVLLGISLFSAEMASSRESWPGRPFAGEKAVFLGTSLTRQGRYLKYLQAQTQIGMIVNKGVSGQFVSTMADELTHTDLKDAAFVSIEGSTNDYAYGAAPAGDPTDLPGAYSICGGLKHVVQKIRSINPNVMIVVMNNTWRGPIQNDPVPPAPNRYGLTLKDASKAMMETAAFLHLPHWDAYHLSGINSQNYYYYTEDNLHWNEDGAALIGYGYGDYLNSLRKKFRRRAR